MQPIPAFARTQHPMKETLRRLFATLTPANTELALQLAIGQGFTDKEIEEMRPKCYGSWHTPLCNKIAVSVGDYKDSHFSNVGKPVCENCSLPF